MGLNGLLHGIVNSKVTVADMLVAAAIMEKGRGLYATLSEKQAYVWGTIGEKFAEKLKEHDEKGFTVYDMVHAVLNHQPGFDYPTDDLNDMTDEKWELYYEQVIKAAEDMRATGGKVPLKAVSCDNDDCPHNKDGWCMDTGFVEVSGGEVHC